MPTVSSAFSLNGHDSLVWHFKGSVVGFHILVRCVAVVWFFFGGLLWKLFCDMDLTLAFVMLVLLDGFALACKHAVNTGEDPKGKVKWRCHTCIGLICPYLLTCSM